jgi:hypothetical protein
MYRTDVQARATRSAKASARAQVQIRVHEAQVQVVSVADGCRCALGRLVPTHRDFTHFPEDRRHQDARNRADLRTLAGTEHIRRRAA